MKKNKAEVLIPANLDNSPEQHEIDAALILANHYNTVVEFLRPIDDYLIKTPDIRMTDRMWEMKSPVGNSKNTVSHQIKRAVKQSVNIVFDGRRSSIQDSVLEKELKREAGKHPSIRKIIFIDKEKNVVEIIWK
ncbi:MAG: hypothetical protein LBN34_07640 [Clostridiales Family XIII bacterium]|jgi:hypothetical protein|nr:hypothetical protein [Clostridiales Family XIII bacterium]